MKAIIIIKAFDLDRYEVIRNDLSRQIKELGWPDLVFCYLRAENCEEIDIIWLDQDYRNYKE